MSPSDAVKSRVGNVLMLIENASFPFDRRMRHFAEALRGAGYNVSVICPRGKEFDQSGYAVIDGIKVWRRDTDPKTAALALALVAVLCGLIATAFLEPFLDEYRLATLFGVSLGMLRGTVTSMIGRLPVWHSEEIGPPVATEVVS